MKMATPDDNLHLMFNWENRAGEKCRQRRPVADKNANRHTGQAGHAVGAAIRTA